MTSKHTLLNTITGPNDYISFIQPSEAATPVLETNTYYKEITLTKTWRDDSSAQIVSSTANNLLTQVVVTESLPSRSTSVMTSYFAFDAFDTTQQQYQLPLQNDSAFQLKTVATDLLHSPLLLYHSSSADADEEAIEMLTLLDSTSLSTTTLPEFLNSDSKIDYNLHIYATKTFLTTFTYFTTTLLKSANVPSSDLVITTNTQGGLVPPLSSSTVVDYHTRVIENVITETIPSSLLGTNLLSRFYDELKKNKNQRKVIVTQATLRSGQTLEITAMKIQKPEIAASTSLAKQQSITVKQPLSDATKAVSKVKPLNSNWTPSPATSTIHSNNSDEIVAAADEEDDSDSVVASSEQHEVTYEQPSSKPLKNARPIYHPSATSANNELTKIEKPPPLNSSNLPGTVNQIIGSFNLQRLTALRPVFNAMAGLLNNNFGIGATADKLKNPTEAKQPAVPQPHPLQIESKHALKNITAANGNNYETLPVSYAERPIYIPVQNLVTVGATHLLGGNFSNTTLSPYHDDISLVNPSKLSPPQSLHIQPPAAEVFFSNENWFAEAANKLLPPSATNHINAGAADSKNHQKSGGSTFETSPLLNGGIPISPGEVITANSDVIIGRPNGIQHPRVPPLNSKSAEMTSPPAAQSLPLNDNNVAATNYVPANQLADVPYTTFYQHFIQHPHPPPAYNKKSALSNVGQKQLQSAIPLNANFNESILKPPPFLYTKGGHQSLPAGLYSKTYAVAPPPSYIQLPPPPPQQPLNLLQKNNQKQSNLQQHHLLYIPQGYTETKYFSHLPGELHKFYNFNKELQNNEVLEIKRIPEVFSTDLPPVTEFTASYLPATQRPLEEIGNANKNTGGEGQVQNVRHGASSTNFLDWNVQHVGHASNPNLLQHVGPVSSLNSNFMQHVGHASSPNSNLFLNVQPTRITNIVIPPHDNAASALVVASTTSMIYNQNNAPYFDAAAATAKNTGGTSPTAIPTLKPIQLQSSSSQNAATNHQKINFDMNVFSHNVDINVPPLTFKNADTDEFPPSSAPVLGQITTKQMGGAPHKMPLVKIPLNEEQVQVKLTPQRFIGIGVIESNSKLAPSVGNFKQTHQQQQLIIDNSAIGSFALEPPQFRGTPPAIMSQQQHHLAKLKPERHRFNKNPYSSPHVTIQENPLLSIKMNKVSPAVTAVNNFGLKLTHESNPMLSSLPLPTLVESSYESSNNFDLRNKPPLTSTAIQSAAVEYAISSKPYPPHHNIEKPPSHTPKYQQNLGPNGPNKKQRRPSMDSLLEPNAPYKKQRVPSLDPLPDPNATNKNQRRPSLGPLTLNMNAHLGTYLPTKTTVKTTVVTTTPPETSAALDYWNHNFVTDDNGNDDAVTSSLKDGASLYTTSIVDQKAEASLNSLRLSDQHQQHKESSDNIGDMKLYKNKWPFLNDQSILEVNNMPNLVTNAPSSSISSSIQLTAIVDSNKTRDTAIYNQIHKLPTNQGKPFKAQPTQTGTTNFPKKQHQPPAPQQIFVTTGEGFKHKVIVQNETEFADTQGQITGKYVEIMPNTPLLSTPENSDAEDEIFDYYETSNIHNFETVNTTANVIGGNDTTTSKATPTTASYSIRPIKENSNAAVTSSVTTRNNKNNGFYHIHPPPPPSAATQSVQQSQADKAVFGLSPPPAPASIFSLPTLPYKTINYTSSQNDLQRLSLQPPPLPKLNHQAPPLTTNPRQPPNKPRPTLSKSSQKVLASNLSPPTPVNPQHHTQTPQLSSTPFAISTSINFIPRLGQLESSSRIRFQITETPEKSKTISAAPSTKVATSPLETQFTQSLTKSTQPIVLTTTRTTTISNSVKPSKILLSSQGGVKNQHRANTQLLPARLASKQQITLPTKFVTNTQVLTVTTTKTTVLTVAGKHSTKTLTFTKTQTATILDTVTETEIHTLLQPTRVTESHIILATTTVPVPAHLPVSVTKTAGASTTVTPHESNVIPHDADVHDGNLSNHKPYEKHSTFDVDETKFNGIAHPSVEVVPPDAIIQQQQKVTTEKNPTTASSSKRNNNTVANNSIFIVMTDSTSAKTGGNKKNVININPNMLESAHEINAIGVITAADTTSSSGPGAGGVTAAGDSTGTYIAADSLMPLDYYDNVSFDFPTLDEESGPTANKENHVLLGGVLIATPPKSNSSPRKPPIDSSTTKKQNVNEVLPPEQNSSVSGVVGSTTSNAVCRPACKASRNELCMRVQQQMSTRCVCRPGFARMFPDRPCKRTYYTLFERISTL